MKNIILIICSACVLAACNSKPHNPDKVFADKAVKQKILVDVVTRVHDLAVYADKKTRFNAEFRSFYEDMAKNYEIQYAEKKGEQVYIAVSRPAPSNYVKKTSIGCVMQLDAENNIVAFDEVYYADKFLLEKLDSASIILFEEMLTTGNVDKYIGQGDLLMFPDKTVRYSPLLKEWIIIDTLTNPNVYPLNK